VAWPGLDAGPSVNEDRPSSEAGAAQAAARRAVGDELRATRRGAGLTQTEAARALGLAQTSVSAMERGVYLPDETTWRRLVETYAMPPGPAGDLWERIRTARTLRGAAATGEAVDGWPVDPARLARRAWCGALRRHHRLTRNELAERLGVPVGAVAKLEQDDRPLPAALRTPATLRALAALGDTDELALRVAWQPEEIGGIEHLVGLEGADLVAAAGDVVSLLRWLLATGRTQAQIAAVCGVSRPAVSQWLTRRTGPAEGKLDGLAVELGVDEAALEALR
jgi:transcriptional regulator with XRE-family HTH domain